MVKDNLEGGCKVRAQVKDPRQTTPNKRLRPPNSRDVVSRSGHRKETFLHQQRLKAVVGFNPLCHPHKRSSCIRRDANGSSCCHGCLFDLNGYHHAFPFKNQAMSHDHHHCDHPITTHPLIFFNAWPLHEPPPYYCVFLLFVTMITSHAAHNSPSTPAHNNVAACWYTSCGTATTRARRSPCTRGVASLRRR